MTAKVHWKCAHHDIYTNKCKLKGVPKNPWDDSCPDYDLKPELKMKEGKPDEK